MSAASKRSFAWYVWTYHANNLIWSVGDHFPKSGICRSSAFSSTGAVANLDLQLGELTLADLIDLIVARTRPLQPLPLLVDHATERHRDIRGLRPVKVIEQRHDMARLQWRARMLRLHPRGQR